MSKDFDIWNTQKKQVQKLNTKLYHERDIWWCVLGVNVGSEQDGGGRDHQRPILIVKSISKEVCFVIPLTTSTSVHKYRIPLGAVDDHLASGIISQMRIVDTRRFINKIMVLEKEKFQEVQKAIRNMFF